MPHALVSGTSIAGLATAYWLIRTGWRVTLLERAAAFRDGGQNIDVRGTAKEVLDRMGLTEAVREHSTTEIGTRFVDDEGRPVGEFPVTGDAAGEDGPTAELEILRGDLASLIAEALPQDPEWIFDDIVTGVDDPADGPLEVRLAGGRRVACDLLVVAEGVRSTTRELLLPDRATLDPLGLYLVYGTIPRTAADDRWWRWYTAPGSRQATLRPDNRGTTRATLAWLSEPLELERAHRDDLVAGLRETFHDAGWEVPRILDGMAASDDVYVDYLTQVQLDSYAAGRVVLTGDAAWCVTPLGGGGASLALVGGYVLAAFLAEHGDDRRTALRAYEEWMRPLVEDVQDLPAGLPRLAYPSSEIGVWLLRRVTTLASTRPARRLASAFTSGPESGRKLPPSPVG